MYFSMGRCWKALLIISVAWSCVLFGADANVAVDGNKLSTNTADIGLVSTINGDNHMDIVINPGGHGCTAGQWWDIGVGRCTSAVTLRTETTSRSCTCTCPEEGTCTSSQTGTYPVFGWRLPTAGNELISGYGATTWNACQVVTNACVGGTAPPGGEKPPPGTLFYFDAFICNSSHPQYSSGPLSAANKNSIISTYIGFNYGGRCPEAAGYVYWQSEWLRWAQSYQNDNPGTSLDVAMAKTWAFPTQDSMLRAADKNGESSPSYASVLNAECSRYGSAKYGVSITATYIINSGATCIVN